MVVHAISQCIRGICARQNVVCTWNYQKQKCVVLTFLKLLPWSQQEEQCGDATSLDRYVTGTFFHKSCVSCVSQPQHTTCYGCVQACPQCETFALLGIQSSVVAIKDWIFPRGISAHGKAIYENLLLYLLKSRTINLIKAPHQKHHRGCLLFIVTKPFVSIFME